MSAPAEHPRLTDQCAWCHQPLLRDRFGSWYHRLSQSAECNPGRLGSSQATLSARGGGS